jgi:hypothetical protein
MLIILILLACHGMGMGMGMLPHTILHPVLSLDSKSSITSVHRLLSSGMHNAYGNVNISVEETEQTIS